MLARRTGCSIEFNPIQLHSLLVGRGRGNIIRLASVHKSRGEGRRKQVCVRSIRDLGNARTLDSGFRIRTRFRNYRFSLSLSLSNRWTEPLRRCPTHNELVKLERDSIIGISMRVPAVFETWPRVLQEIASRIRRMGEKRRRRNTSAQTSGKITEGHPISTFNGNHSEREIIAFNHHRISFAIHPFLPPDIPSSLSHSLSYLSFQASFHRLERPVAARRREEYNTTSPLPPFFHTRERFGVNRNRISRERRLQAIREVFTPSCEGTSIRERGGGSTIEGRKGHGSRNLSSVAQHCCHGRFALSAGRIDGGAECCWVRSLFLDACIAVQAGDSPARQCA